MQNCLFVSLFQLLSRQWDYSDLIHTCKRINVQSRKYASSPLQFNSLQKHTSSHPVCWPNHHWTSGKQNSCFKKLKLQSKIQSCRNRSLELSFTSAGQWAAMREPWGFALEMLLAILSAQLMSMAGIIFMIALFAALQFCGLMCESTVLARIYCPPILLHKPTSALCPSSLCCKCLLPGPHCSIFPPFFSLPLLLFSSLCSLFQMFYLPFFTRVPEKAKIDPALWLTPQVGR